jgi:hypothetical protein
MNGDLVLKSARGQTPHIFIAAPLPVTLVSQQAKACSSAIYGVESVKQFGNDRANKMRSETATHLCH